MRRLLIAGIITGLVGTPAIAQAKAGGSGGDAAGDTAGAIGVASAPGGRPGGTDTGGPHLTVPGGDDYAGVTPEAVQAQADAIRAKRDPINGEPGRK